MKTKMYPKIAILFAFFLFVSTPSNAQFEKLKEKVTKKTNERVESNTNNAIDKGLDKVENRIKSLFKKKKKKNANKTSTEGQNNQTTNQSQNGTDDESTNVSTGSKTTTVEWSKFDFVPGDEVIFEDSPSASEENGEFPSRWDLEQGQIEIMKVDGNNVIGFIDGNPRIVPYLKNSKQDYLPEVFTVEFDIYRPAKGNRFTLDLYDKKNQKYIANTEVEINLNRADIGNVISEYDSGKNNEEGNWIHVSLAYTKGKLKVYLDQNRLLNIPHYEQNSTGLSFQAYWADAKENKIWYMKNIRIAKGGVKYYDRVISDGKIIVNGIKFDINKATLKPESMGPINEIYTMMAKNPDLKFSVEGHTDSDGNDANNQTLSEARAKTVMNQLVSMGISNDRLKSTGYGESKPIADNSSAEGKANNRRVEFVKF